jgi:hypothetical protein
LEKDFPIDEDYGHEYHRKDDEVVQLRSIRVVEGPPYCAVQDIRNQVTMMGVVVRVHATRNPQDHQTDENTRDEGVDAKDEEEDDAVPIRTYDKTKTAHQRKCLRLLWLQRLYQRK